MKPRFGAVSLLLKKVFEVMTQHAPHIYCCVPGGGSVTHRDDLGVAVALLLEVAGAVEQVPLQRLHLLLVLVVQPLLDVRQLQVQDREPSQHM
jgi:hypothetical protein